MRDTDGQMRDFNGAALLLDAVFLSPVYLCLGLHFIALFVSVTLPFCHSVIPCLALPVCVCP